MLLFANIPKYNRAMHAPSGYVYPDGVCLPGNSIYDPPENRVFENNGLFKIAEEGVSDDTIKRISKRVNGGYHGLDDRREQTNKIYGWLS